MRNLDAEEREKFIMELERPYPFQEDDKMMGQFSIDAGGLIAGLDY